MIEILLFAAAVTAGAWVLAVLYRDKVEEVCIEDGCHRPATHERFEEMVGDDVMTVLVCRRHGGWRRT